MTSKLKCLVASGIISAALMSASSAYAAGTTQGTDVTNSVTVDYSVGGVDQPDITSNTDTFEVDRVILFTVAEDTSGSRGGDTTVAPDEDDAVTYFVVTNTSNDTVDFDLSVSETDTNNILSGATAFVESGATLGYQAGEDTATFIDELPEDGSVVVYVVGDIATGATNGQNADVTLTGTAHVAGGAGLGTIYSTAGTGAALVSDDSDANTAGVETIFGDTGRDGVEADDDGYTVGAADLSVFKSSRVISDPVSSSNPKAIPGAIVEYCIAVTNGAGATTATGVSLSDVLDLTNVDYETSTIFVDSTVTDAGLATQACAGGTSVTDSSADADAGSYTSGTSTVAGTLSDIAGGTTRGLRFRVSID